MLKLFTLALTLFFTIPTHSMRINPSRLQQRMMLQRSYATMAQKDFDKLVDDPLPLRVFTSELATMKKDNEDLKDLRIKLLTRVYHFEDRCEHPSPRVDIGCLAITLPATLVGIEQMTKAISHVIESHSVPGHAFFAIPLVFISGCISVDCLSDLKKFVVLKRKLNLYKKKLAYVESLIDKVAREEKNKE
jgi:hypothetical protein